MGWKWENNAHSECRIHMSVTAGNNATLRPSCDSQPKFLDSTNTDVVMGISYHEDFRLCVKWANLWREKRKEGRKRGCDGAGAVGGVERKAGRSLLCHNSLLSQVSRWESSSTDSKVDEVTYLAIASSHFYIIFTWNSPNENRSCEESN